MKFIRIDDKRVTKIPIHECREHLVDIARKGWIIVRTQKRNTEFSKVRKDVATRLKIATSFLLPTYRLELEDGFRPMKKQREYFRRHLAIIRKKHPQWNDKKLYKETSLFVAPPEKTPPHTTGGAVDVLLCAADGTLLNLGGGVGSPNDGYDERAYTDSIRVTKEQRRLRVHLCEAMTKAGFCNYPAEWWHWSYGDQYWAYMTGHEFALYGSV